MQNSNITHITQPCNSKIRGCQYNYVAFLLALSDVSMTDDTVDTRDELLDSTRMEGAAHGGVE